MVEASNTMTVTYKGLSTTSKILINSYSYNGDVEIVGTPIINNGIASSLSSYSYLKKSGTSLSGLTANIDNEVEEHTVTVNFEGTFVPGTAPSVPFCLTGESVLSASLTSTSLIVNLDDLSILSLTGFSIPESYPIQISITINPNFLEAKLIINGSMYSKKIITSIDNYSFNNTLIGIDYEGSDNFWKGEINLSKFFIYLDNSVLYSPSTKEDIEFSSILVSNANFTLTDSSVPLIGAIYEFPLEELSRTGNNILLKATIGSSAHLNIGNVGLYCHIAGKRYLFSVITGLDIKKGKDIPYELIIHVNLDINIVNTVVRPEIIIRKAKFTPQSYFADVKRTIFNSIIDIERCIKKNAIQLGYNTAQVFYREEKYLQEGIRGCESASRLSLLEKLYNLKPLLFYSSLGETLHSYRLFDLSTSMKSRNLEFLDSSFKGEDSVIDLSKNCTLSLVTNWSDISDRILLSKVNLSNSDIYFTLELSNAYLIFTYYTEEEVYTFSYFIRPELTESFLGTHILSIMNEDNVIKFYKDTELFGTIDVDDTGAIDTSSDFYLLNYTDETDINSAVLSFTDLLYFDKALQTQDIINLLKIFGL